MNICAICRNLCFRLFWNQNAVLAFKLYDTKFVFEHRCFREIVPVYSENVRTIMSRLVRMWYILVLINL